jgi:chromatin segregation and condensation protein Rec8/ScpA/Scc1 (kleisin family)
MNQIDIIELIRDYRMMKNEIDRLQTILYGEVFPMSSWGVAQYGIEAALPKGSKGKSQAELKEMDIREQKQWERLNEYQRKVIAIESAGDFLEKEIHKIVYDCMLSNMTRKQIASHLEISLESVDKLRLDIKSQIETNQDFAKLLYGQPLAV